MKKLIILLLLASCASAPILPVPALPPIQEVKYVGLWPVQDYTNTLVTAINLYGQELVKVIPRDAEEWCFNKYPDKKQFYVSLVSAMSKYESNWKPETSYTENFKDNKGNFVVSVGLLQISSESCAGYGLPYLVNSELKKNENNLKCTVKILNKWIVSDQVIAQSNGSTSRGGARYWSVLRTGSIHKREAIKAMVCK